MELTFKNRKLAWPRRPLVMAIINVNDDSFSGDGQLDPGWAAETASRAISDGADIIDVGAESARTNREVISVAEEVARFHSFTEKWESIVSASSPRDESQIWPPILSANTWRPEVVKEVLPMGFDLLNDMSALAETTNAELCREHRCAILLMHSVGLPKVSHRHVRWDNVTESLAKFFSDKLAEIERTGLPLKQVILDPGLGFAKTAENDLTVIKELERLHQFERPILLPVGRKGFIGETLDIKEPKERDAATLACVSAGMIRGAQIFRVHDAKACFEAVKVLSALGDA